jgi:hypothetical protein
LQNQLSNLEELGMNETCGLLFSKSGPVPLTSVSVKGDIMGRARIKMSQRFKNKEKNAVEAVYKFSISEGAAVCGFSADIDGKKITGHIEDREKAFEIYDNALEKGDGGYFLDWEINTTESDAMHIPIPPAAAVANPRQNWIA